MKSTISKNFCHIGTLDIVDIFARTDGSTTSNFTVYILFQKCALLIANVLTFYWLNCKSRDNDIKAPNGLDWSGLEVNPGPDQNFF